MSIALAAVIEAIPGRPEIRDGWRGLLDFGEKWSQEDADVWPQCGELPLGKPLTYGCELNRDSPDSPRVALRLFAVQDRRKVMQPGATFVLRDGQTARASGTLL